MEIGFTACCLLPPVRTGGFVWSVRLPVLLMLMAAAGCGLTDPRAANGAGELSRDNFTAAYVALRRAQLQNPTPAAFEAAKRQILEQHGVSEDDMMDFVQRHSRDVQYMAELWESLELRITSPDSAS
jgi:signal transduction histidine kinase